MENVFADDLLAIDRTKAGVVKIPRPIREPDSIVGKHLPDFNDIEIEFTREHARDKMVLVCFFDMQQRPSRNCLWELSAKVQELKAKDVTIVAVHASKVERKKVDEWIKENKISFSVGMIQSEIDKTKFAWGVRALPWLILTDKEHIVCAEGFAWTELDAKVEDVAP